MATDRSPRRPGGRLVAAAARPLRWLLPAAGLILLPKCPACLAAYLALATGITISLSAAAQLRLALLAACLAALTFLAIRAIRALRRNPRHPTARRLLQGAQNV